MFPECTPTSLQAPAAASCGNNLYRRYNRVILLLISSLIAYYAVTFLNTQVGQASYLLNVISNIGVFCIWEIGNTHFTRQEASVERKKIIRARDAEIIFQEKRNKNTADRNE